MKFVERSFLRQIRMVLLHSELNALYVLSAAQIVLVILDLVALGLAGLLATSFVPIIQSKPDNMPYFFEVFYEEFGTLFSLYEFIFILAGFSGSLLILRSILSVKIEQSLYKKLQKITGRLIEQVIRRHYSSTLEKRKKQDFVHTSYAVNDSMNSFTIYAIGSLLTVFTEVLSVTILFIALILWEPLLTLTFAITLGASAGLAFRFHVKKSQTLRNDYSRIQTLNVHEFNKLDSISNELFLRNLRNEWITNYNQLRGEVTEVLIQRQIQFGVPRLILESTVVLGGLISSMTVWYFLSISEGLVVLATYMIAGARLQPAVMKIQNGLQVFMLHKNNSQMAISLVSYYDSHPENIVEENLIHIPGPLRLDIRDLSYLFDVETETLNYSDVTLKGPGIFLLKGKNGTGKSTLLEIIASLRAPNSGVVSLMGVPVTVFSDSERSNTVAFSPQNPAFTEQTITESLYVEQSLGESAELNLALLILKDLGFDFEKYKLNELMNLSFVLSEGEKQKINLARTLCRNTPIVLLDEPTTSLDSGSLAALRELLIKSSASRLILMATHENYFDNIATATIRIGN